METSGKKLIEVSHVTKQFSGGAVKALDDCSLTIGKGDVVAIIGPSGSGKSTLLRCMNLLETPTSGQVFIDGVDITQKKVDILSVREGGRGQGQDPAGAGGPGGQG